MRGAMIWDEADREMISPCRAARGKGGGVDSPPYTCVCVWNDWRGAWCSGNGSGSSREDDVPSPVRSMGLPWPLPILKGER
jgi:hypothetical protein